MVEKKPGPSTPKTPTPAPKGPVPKPQPSRPPFRDSGSLVKKAPGITDTVPPPTKKK